MHPQKLWVVHSLSLRRPFLPEAARVAAMAREGSGEIAPEWVSEWRPEGTVRIGASDDRIDPAC